MTSDAVVVLTDCRWKNPYMYHHTYKIRTLVLPCAQKPRLFMAAWDAEDVASKVKSALDADDMLALRGILTDLQKAPLAAPLKVQIAPRLPFVFLI